MITFEEVRLQDIPEVQRLLETTWEQTFIDCLTPYAIEQIASEWFNPELLSRQVHDPEIFFVMAKDASGKIAGIATARRKEKVVYLSRLYVLPEYQGQRIGSRLLEHVIHAFPHTSKITLTVLPENTPAVAFYKRYGFSITEKRMETTGDTELELLVMDKNL